MKQQTAVEWLTNELANTGLLVAKDIDNLVAYSKAKQMEKVQIIEAYNESWHNRMNPYKTAEKYYKETYK